MLGRKKSCTEELVHHLQRWRDLNRPSLLSLPAVGYSFHARTPHLLYLAHPIHHRFLRPPPQRELGLFEVLQKDKRQETTAGGRRTLAMVLHTDNGGRGRAACPRSFPS